MTVLVFSEPFAVDGAWYSEHWNLVPGHNTGTAYVSGNVGFLNNDPGQGPTVVATTYTSALDQEVTGTYRQVAEEGAENRYLNLVLRAQVTPGDVSNDPTVTGMGVLFTSSAGGTVQAQPHVRGTDGSSFNIGDVVSLTGAPGALYHFKVRIVGTQLTLWFYADGGVESVEPQRFIDFEPLVGPYASFASPGPLAFYYTGTGSVRLDDIDYYDLNLVADLIPQPPRNVGVGLNYGRATIAWIPDNSDDGLAVGSAVGYRVYRNGIEIAQVLRTSAWAWADYAFRPDGTTYTYSVTAYNDAGESAPRTAPPGSQTLPAPVIRAVPVNTTTTTIRITNPITEDGLGWELYDTGSTTPRAFYPSGADGVTLTGDLDEEFSVYAKYLTQSDYHSPISNTVTGRFGLPVPPTDLHATATTTSLTLTWSHEGYATGYRLYIAAAGHEPLLMGSLAPGGPHTWTFTGLTPGTSYVMEVSAYGYGGESARVDLTTSTTSGDYTPPTDPFDPYDPPDFDPDANIPDYGDPDHWTTPHTEPDAPATLAAVIHVKAIVTASAYLYVPFGVVPEPDPEALSVAVVPEYTYVIADLLTGTPLDELTFSNVSYNQVLCAPGAFHGTLRDTDPKLTPTLLKEGQRSITVYRNGEVMWSGVLWTVRVDPYSQTVEVGGEGYWSLLRRRVLRDSQAFVATPTFDIFNTVLAVTHAVHPPQSDTGLLVDPVTPTSPAFTGTYYAHEYPNVGTLLEELSETSSTEFRVNCYLSDNQVARVLEVGYPRLGRTAADTGLVWELGVNLRSFTQEYDATRRANVVTAIGAGDGPTTLVRSAGLPYSPEDPSSPLLEAVVSYKTVTQPATLQAYATADRQALLSGVSLSAVSVDPSILGTFLVGDEGLLVAYRPPLTDLQGLYRIVSYEVSVSENRGESLSLTLAPSSAFGAP